MANEPIHSEIPPVSKRSFLLNFASTVRAPVQVYQPRTACEYCFEAMIVPSTFMGTSGVIEAGILVVVELSSFGRWRRRPCRPLAVRNFGARTWQDVSVNGETASQHAYECAPPIPAAPRLPCAIA